MRLPVKRKRGITSSSSPRAHEPASLGARPRIAAGPRSHGVARQALISARMALDDVNDAFAAMERQEGIRSVLTFS